MPVFIYRVADGSLYSWSPDDGGQVASDADLTANGLAKTTGPDAIDAGHDWDAATKTVVAVTPALPSKTIGTGPWIMRFTPAEFQAITASADPTLAQFMFALNHTTQVDLNDPIMVNGVNYLVSINLLQSSRVAAIMAPAGLMGQ